MSEQDCGVLMFQHSRSVAHQWQCVPPALGAYHACGSRTSSRQHYKAHAVHCAHLSCPLYAYAGSATAAVGLEAAAGHYTTYLLDKASAAAGGVAILFHGMGGIGKTTLALELFSKLSATGCFTGREYKVSINRQFVKGADYDALVQMAQRELLGQVCGRHVPETFTTCWSAVFTCAQLCFRSRALCC